MIVSDNTDNIGDVFNFFPTTCIDNFYKDPDDVRNFALSLDYNDNSGNEVRSKYVLELEQNKSIALCCDSGTPLISDPGYKLVRQVIRDGYKVICIPGACSVIVALCQSGLPSDKFFFGGFPPAKKKSKD